MKEITVLKRIYNNPTQVYPFKVVVPHPFKGAISTQFTVDNKRDVARRIKEWDKAQEGKYACWFCRKYYKEGHGGRTLPMDKREAGDGLFGEAFVCFKCVPKEFGRL